MKSHVEFQVGYSTQKRRRSLVVLLRAVVLRVERWNALYRQRQQLAALGDDALKDIGLSRADIESEVNRPFWDDPLQRG